MDATKQYTKRTATQIVLDVAAVTPKSAVRSHGKITPIQTRKNRSGTNTKLAAKTFHLNLYTHTPKSAASKMPRSDEVATSGLETNASATCPVNTLITRTSAAKQNMRKIILPGRPRTSSITEPIDFPWCRTERKSVTMSCIEPMKMQPRMIHRATAAQPNCAARTGPMIGPAPAMAAKWCPYSTIGCAGT